MSTEISEQAEDIDDIAPEPRYTGAYLEMLISGLLGLVAALVLSIDAVKLADNPDVELSCNVSKWISCTKVGTSWQASVLGDLPNAFIGLISEPVVITIAIASLGGVRFPRWFMLSAQAVYSIGFLFAYWLFYQAYFNIKALCPWCLLITITTTLVFMSMTRVNILSGNLGSGLQRRMRTALTYYHADTVLAVLIFAVLAAMIVYRYA